MIVYAYLLSSPPTEARTDVVLRGDNAHSKDTAKPATLVSLFA